MHVQFKHPRIIDGIHFTVGAHHLDDKLKSHWFFEALVKQGDVVILQPKLKAVPDLSSVGSVTPSTEQVPSPVPSTEVEHVHVGEKSEQLEPVKSVRAAKTTKQSRKGK